MNQQFLLVKVFQRCSLLYLTHRTQSYVSFASVLTNEKDRKNGCPTSLTSQWIQKYLQSSGKTNFAVCHVSYSTRKKKSAESHSEESFRWWWWDKQKTIDFGCEIRIKHTVSFFFCIFCGKNYFAPF